MKITKRHRTGGRILALLMSCCLLSGVFPGTVTAADDTEKEALVLDKWVDKTEDGFKLTLESYATGSDETITTEPVPLDIVLVLDESGSMADVLINGCNNENGTDVSVTPKGHLADGVTLDESQMDRLLFVGHKVFSGNVDTSKTYTVVYPADGTTRDIYYCAECGAWYSNTNHKDHPNIAKWIPFDDENGTPTEVHENGNWTCNVQFYERCGQTGRDLLQKALGSFLETLYDASNPDGEEQVENRVAIVGYGMGASYINTDGKRTQVYADPGNGPGGDPVTGSGTSAANAWCDVSEMEKDSITTWVNGVHAEGSTPTHLGIEAAELAFENAPATEDKNRAKVMILFTDGTPGADYNNYGPGSSQYPDWVTPGIKSAKAMKDDGVTIYSVGLFPSADGYNAEKISYNVEANGQGTPGFFANANCFLHLVSSNYPDATGVAAGERGSLSDEYVENENSFYLGTSDATQLAGIFEQISEEVTPGSTTVTLDETAIVKDKITSDFQITYTDNAANVTAYTMSYAGDDDSGNMRWTKDEDSVSTIADANNPDKLHISVSGQTVSVTNFDFAENFVHMLHKDDGADTPQGKKLVVEIDIAAADDSQGGIKLATNATNTTHTDNAGIYGPDSDQPVAEFPLPHVDLPTTVTIQKVVKGIESTEDFSFEAEYVEAGDYENITAEESGGANDSNYLHLKDGTDKTDTFTLKDGGTHKLENVEAGSSLTISETAKGWIPTVTTSTGTEALTPDADGSYTVTVTPGMRITFTNRPETINISGSKTWDDADNQDGKRPDSITIRLYADGTELKDKALTVTAEDGWKWSFTDLPKYADGKEITYTISEDTVDGYTPAYSDFNVTNSYTPEQTSVKVTKAWMDNNNQDGIRPENITVKLLANGQDTGENLVLSDGNDWTGTFTGLDKYQNGQEIVYTIEEVKVNGYNTTITGDASTGFVITNSHTPATTEVSGSKTWDDADNQDGKRPDSITIRLYADGTELKDKALTVTAEDGWKWSFTDLPKYADGKEITYTISEDTVDGYTPAYSDFNVTNSYTPEQTSVKVTKAWMDNNNQDGIRPENITVKLLANGQDTGENLVLSDGNDWTGTFTGLDKYQNGKEISYTVEETAVSGYDTVIAGDASTGFVITNSHTPETTEVSGSKTWDDADNQDGKRPDSITIRLYADGTEVAHKEVTAEDGWKWSFTDLPKYTDGDAIIYTITEDAVPGYTSKVDGFNVTNSYTPGKTSVTVTKAWNDADNQDGLRPAEVTVKLLANGKDTGESLTLSKANRWTGIFTDLNEYKDGEKIVYTIEEAAVDGYESVITGDASTGFMITNSHTPAAIALSGSKTWDDADNQDGKRPDSITIRLYANGTEVAHKEVTAEDGWKWSFTDLPKYADGKEITYTITEDAVTDYQSEVNGMDVTNHYTPGQVNISVTKNWQDQNDADGIRPDSITVKLYADGKDTGKELVLNQKNNWTGSFDNLDEYADGVKIIYTIAEAKVDGYDTAISGSAETGFVISNSHTPAIPDTPDKPNTPTDPDEPKQTPGQSETPDTPKGDTPQTGDTTNLALWIGLLAISGTGLTATLVLGKKKRYRGKYIK